MIPVVRDMDMDTIVCQKSKILMDLLGFDSFIFAAAPII